MTENDFNVSKQHDPELDRMLTDALIKMAADDDDEALKGRLVGLAITDRCREIGHDLRFLRRMGIKQWRHYTLVVPHRL